MLESPVVTIPPQATAPDASTLTTFDRTWSAEECAALKRMSGLSVTVAIPARDEEPTIGPICEGIVEALMRGPGVVDELIVLDGCSTDLTSVRARAAGARVLDVSDVLPDLPVHPGKGESLWRSLAVIETDLVVWVDGDIRNFDSRFITNLVGPLLARPDLDYVKAYYRRPLQLAESLVPHNGGRVTELLAKPLLAALFPELNEFRQPLSGEYAARTEVMRDLPFFSGYSVEVGLLVDMLFQIGLPRMAQADLGTRVHRNRPLLELGPMAGGLARTILQRAAAYGRITFDDATGRTLEAALPGASLELERPPMTLVQGDWTLQLDDSRLDLLPARRDQA